MVWDRSAAVKKSLQGVNYLYIQHINSSSTNYPLYTENTYWEEQVLNELQGAMLPIVFDSLPFTIAATMEIKKPESPSESCYIA